MRKLVITFLLLLLPTISWSGWWLVSEQKGTTPATCSDTPFLTQDTHAAAAYIGYGDATSYAGMINVGASSVSICSLDLYAKEVGALSGETLYVEHWSVNSSTLALVSKIADITTVDPSSFTSAYAYESISFGSTVTVDTDEAIVFRLSTTPNSTNYVGTAIATSNPVADWSSRSWTSLYAVQGTSTSDLRMKLYGE
jgi:hypothetical protein